MLIEQRASGTIEADGDNERTVSGYAHRYGATYDFEIYSWATEERTKIREVFEPGAFDTADRSSMYFRHNHNMQMRGLAHPRNGTLKVTPDEFGLRYTAVLSDTQAGNDLYTDIRSGLITEMSFAFALDDEDENAVEYKRLNNEMIERRIKRVKRLYDVSTVDFPAYSGTSVESKSVETGAEEMEQRNGFSGLNRFLKNERQERATGAKLDLEKERLKALIDLEI